MTQERRPGWLFSWAEAGQNQRKVFLAFFIQGALGFGLLAYFRLTPNSLIGSVLVGLAGGALLAFVGIRYSRNPALVRTQRKVSAYEVVIGAVGLALIVAGVAAQSANLFVAGLPLLALSLLLIALKNIVTK